MLRRIGRAFRVIGIVGAVTLATITEAAAIFGGAEAPPRAYSFMVSLYIKKEGNSYLCGGSLIAEQWVLTAAHCLKGVASPGDIRVFAGSDQRWDGDEIAAGQFWVHEGFNDLIENDIALIRLSRPPRPGLSVSTINLSTDPQRYADLPPENDPLSPEGARALVRATQRTVRVAGWGMTGPSKLNSAADTLQVLEFRVANRRYCEARWILPTLDTLQGKLASFGLSRPKVYDLMNTVLASTPHAVPAGTLCASSRVDMFGDPVGSGIMGELFGKGPVFADGGGDPENFWRAIQGIPIESEAGDCPGDSGGPLFSTEQDGSFRQVGIVSFGLATDTVECGSTMAPSVYTSVAAFDGWIRSVMSGR